MLPNNEIRYCLAQQLFNDAMFEKDQFLKWQEYILAPERTESLRTTSQNILWQLFDNAQQNLRDSIAAVCSVTEKDAKYFRTLAQYHYGFASFYQIINTRHFVLDTDYLTKSNEQLCFAIKAWESVDNKNKAEFSKLGIYCLEYAQNLLNKMEPSQSADNFFDQIFGYSEAGARYLQNGEIDQPEIAEAVVKSGQRFVTFATMPSVSWSFKSKLLLSALDLSCVILKLTSHNAVIYKIAHPFIARTFYAIAKQFENDSEERELLLLLAEHFLHSFTSKICGRN